MIPSRLSRCVLASALALLLLGLPGGCGSNEPEQAGPRTFRYDTEGNLQASAEPAPGAPNLIVLVIDALRADALGDADLPARMPFLASLAERGVRFTQAVAPAPWTVPSLTSLLTGLLPAEHGQHRTHDGWNLPLAITTFPEALSAGHGYQTEAYVNGYWFEVGSNNLLQGFQNVQMPFSLTGAPKILHNFARRRDDDRPFFLFLHTFEAHDPYGAENHPWPPIMRNPPPLDPQLRRLSTNTAEVFRACYLDAGVLPAMVSTHGQKLAQVLQNYKWRGYAENPRPDLAAALAKGYWDGVRWVDGLLEKTWAALEREHLLENTVVVIASDHGEAFGEHGGLAHGLRLYDELVHVPLVMIGPGDFTGGRVIDEDIGLIDVLPTFLDYAGLPPLPGVAGRSALEVVRGDTWCRPVISEERLTRRNTGEDFSAIRVSTRTTQWKYIVTYDLRTGEAREEAYDLQLDPEELEDLAEGTGRIPPGQVFDPCFCQLVEQVRKRIWVHHEGNAPSEDALQRPTPCNSGL